MDKNERLIIALDVPLLNASIYGLIDVGVRWFKVRPRWFQQYLSLDNLRNLQFGANFMYDGKLWDTPDSVRGDVQHAFELGFKYITVADEINCVREAIHVARASDQHILVVGNLTSKPFAANQASRYLMGPQGYIASGAVIPPCDLMHFRRKFPKAILVSPGIRMEGDKPNDHESDYGVCTPDEAIRRGATQVVVGRPITQANDPIEAAKRYLEAVTNA